MSDKKGKLKKEYIYVGIVVLVIIVAIIVFVGQKNSDKEVFTEKESKSLEEIVILGKDIDLIGNSVNELDDEMDITA